MKKKWKGAILCLLMMILTAGCGKTTESYLLDVDYSDYVTLCDYNGINATKVDFEVTDTQVQQRINQTMYAYVSYDKVTDRGVQTGDFVNIDYTGTIDGVELAEYTDQARDFLVGEGLFFPEVDAALQGMVTGEEKKIEIILNTESAKNQEEIGKTLQMTIQLNEISVESLPDFNDSFVQTHLGYNSVEAYEEFVKNELEDEKKQQYRDVALEEIITYLKDNCVFDTFPQTLYEECRDNFDVVNTQYAKNYDMTLEEYLKLYGIDAEQKEQLIIQDVNLHLIIGAIAQKEELDCTTEEVEAYYQSNYETYGFENAADFKMEYTKQQIGYEVIYKKVTDLLYQNARFTTITEEEYIEQYVDEDNATIFEEIATDETELVDEPMEVIEDTGLMEESSEDVILEETSTQEASEISE